MATKCRLFCLEFHVLTAKLFWFEDKYALLDTQSANFVTLD